MEVIRPVAADGFFAPFLTSASPHAQLRVRSILWPLSVFLVLALLGSAAWLMARRLSGAIHEPLSEVALLGVGVVSIVLAATARLLNMHSVEATPPPAKRAGIDWLPTLSLALIGTAVSLPGSSVLGIVLLWSLIASEEVGIGILERGRAHLRQTGQPDGSSIVSTASPDSRRPLVSVEHEDASQSERVSQHYTRERDEHGGELIHGVVCVVFARGERTAIEHLVFCPMLAALPVVEVEPLGDVECAVRSTHVYRYGARLEVRLDEPCDESTGVLVAFEVRSPSPAHRC